MPNHYLWNKDTHICYNCKQQRDCPVHKLLEKYSSVLECEKFDFLVKFKVNYYVPSGNPKGRPTDEARNKKILALRKKGWSYQKIADAVGLSSWNSVLYICEGRKKKKKPKPDIPIEERNRRIVEMWKQGMPQRKIADELGIVQGTVRFVLKKEKVI